MSGHVPVLTGTVLSYLSPQAGEVFLDCTLGRGGHAELLIPRLSPGGRYIGLDLDPSNVAFASELNLPRFGARVDLMRANFADARTVLDSLGVGKVDGLLADLGFASTQVEDPARGLSFAKEGPLDMRLDPDLPASAADLVQQLDERELADLIFRFGEERFSRRIARKIVEARSHEPITTTRRLAEVCAAAYGAHRCRSKIDPATRTFQALRIAVNRELENLEQLLESLPTLMRTAGRAVVISFHSLEDRMVKRALADYVAQGRAQRLTRKPVMADEAEAAANRRSRSAKLRAIKWLASQ